METAIYKDTPGLLALGLAGAVLASLFYGAQPAMVLCSPATKSCGLAAGQNRQGQRPARQWLKPEIFYWKA